MNFAQLSESLSPATLAALQMHMEESKEGKKEESCPSNPVSSSSAAPHNSLYAKKEYWDERFTTEESYDWLLKYEDVRSLLVPHLKASDRILIVGCGNSTFSADLYDAGYHNITNIDYSDIVIDKMVETHAASRPEMLWVKMDMCDMTFSDGAFDVIIDKAAMDALMVDEGDVWDPAPSVVEAVHSMCSCVSRILAADGVFLMISFMQPHFRTKYLAGKWKDGTATDKPYASTTGNCNCYQWDLSFDTVSSNAGCLDSFFYVMQRPMTKQEDVNAEDV